jgi:hypothetical protein
VHVVTSDPSCAGRSAPNSCATNGTLTPRGSPDYCSRWPTGTPVVRLRALSCAHLCAGGGRCGDLRPGSPRRRQHEVQHAHEAEDRGAAWVRRTREEADLFLGLRLCPPGLTPATETPNLSSTKACSSSRSRRFSAEWRNGPITWRGCSPRDGSVGSAEADLNPASKGNPVR